MGRIQSCILAVITRNKISGMREAKSNLDGIIKEAMACPRFCKMIRYSNNCAKC